jgi:hypothetical protein
MGGKMMMTAGKMMTVVGNITTGMGVTAETTCRIPGKIGWSGKWEDEGMMDVI